MQKYVFKSKDWAGKTIKGVVEANDRKSAIQLLKDRNLVILSLDEKKSSIFNQIKALIFPGVSIADLANFTRQLATMVDAGLPLADALNLIKEQVKGKLATIIEESLAKIEGGKPLGEALDRYRKVFGQVYISSIKAGEAGGVLDQVLLRLADNLESKKEFRGKVKGAMIYPIIVIIGMIGVAFIMMIFVVPKMTGLYSEMGAEMPLPTRILMSLSEFVGTHVYLFPLIIGVLVVGFKVYQRTEDGRMKIDEIKLKIPIIGPLIEATALTDLTRTLGTLLGTGVSLVQSLKIVGDAAGNEVYKKGLYRAAERVERGLPLAEAISENEAFPLIVSQLISTGEETGKLDATLQNVSRYFQSESEERVKALTAAIEPLIMIVLGIGVGFLVFAVIMPIYNLTSQF